MKRSKFSLSNYKLATMDMGKLVPIGWYEALPGDSVQQRTSCLIRCSPMVAPPMHPVRVRIHHWFVPNRLIWDEWEDFITGGPDGEFAVENPYFWETSVEPGSLDDYMGVPNGTPPVGQRFSALPVRAYNLIYNEHYRDQDLGLERTISKDSGLDTTTDKQVLNVSWEKDYFTTARPWEQKGADVYIPLGDKAPVHGIGKGSSDFGSGVGSVFEAGRSGSVSYDSGGVIDANVTELSAAIEEDPDNPGFPNIFADLSQATGITVNDLRLALAIQRYQEARAQYGSRYVEYLRYLGVRSSDARLQNPEYLGGGRQTIQFSEVLQTAPDDKEPETSVVGDMKGHGISAMRTNRYRRFFEEHGIVLTLLSVVPKSIYFHGLYRGFSRVTKEDYFQKELQFIGEQEVLDKEVNVYNADPSRVFGYQRRYDEYRWMPSDVAGEFTYNLDYWHYARRFSGQVALNQSFTDCTPTKRPHASQETDVLYVMANHSIQARRMMSKFAKPRTF